jgi:hypothetical protein
VGPPRIVRSPQRDGLLVESGRRAERIERIRAVARLPERDAGALGNRLHLLACRAGELERAQIVVREHLGAVLAIRAQRLDPLGRELVLLRPQGARDLAVGDVANEHVPERVLSLGRNRGAPLAPHELLALEPVQALLDRPALEPVHGGERSAPEDLPDHGRVLNERLVLGGERVEPCSDDPLDGLRQGRVVRGSHSPLGDHPGVLLGIERVAPGLGEQRSLRLGRHDGLLEQAG